MNIAVTNNSSHVYIVALALVVLILFTQVNTSVKVVMKTTNLFRIPPSMLNFAKPTLFSVTWWINITLYACEAKRLKVRMHIHTFNLAEIAK